MGTHAAIGIYNKETGTVEASYNHYDGYLEGVGETLVTHYNHPDLALAIATIGYASAVYDTIEETKKEAVHKNEETKIFDSVVDYMKTAGDWAGAAYVYLWDGEAWFVSIDGSGFTDIETLLEEAA